MPINVDTGDVQFLRWPKSVLAAIEQMRADAQGKTIGSMAAAKLFVRYMIQLDPNLNANDLFTFKWVSWRELEEIGKKLEVDGIESDNRVREYLGITLLRLKEWARTSGRRTGKYHTYCQLCWRYANKGQKFCFVHDPQINEAAYRKARRMLQQAGFSHDKKMSIQENLRHWLTGQREVDRVGADKQWQLVLVGQLPMGDWLRKYRKRVFEKIGGSQSIRNITVKMILEQLDSDVSGESSKQIRVAREQLHQRINLHPDELYGLLRRAEVMLAIEVYSAKTRPHGGARFNAGRPASQVKKNTAKNLSKLGTTNAIGC